MYATVDITHTKLLKPWRNSLSWAQVTFYPLFLLPVLGSTPRASLPVRDQLFLTTVCAFIFLMLINLHSFAFFRATVTVMQLSNGLFTLLSPSLALSVLFELLYHITLEEKNKKLRALNWFVETSRTQDLTTSTSIFNARQTPLCFYKWHCHNHIPHNDKWNSLTQRALWEQASTKTTGFIQNTQISWNTPMHKYTSCYGPHITATPLSLLLLQCFKLFFPCSQLHTHIWEEFDQKNWIFNTIWLQ